MQKMKRKKKNENSFVKRKKETREELTMIIRRISSFLWVFKYGLLR